MIKKLIHTSDKTGDGRYEMKMYEDRSAKDIIAGLFQSKRTVIVPTESVGGMIYFYGPERIKLNQRIEIWENGEFAYKAR